jgi:hypothetical protein
MRGSCFLLGIAAAICFCCVSTAQGFEREDYEEDAGSSFAVLLNSEDDIYGISFGSGTWLKGTPIFGDYFIRLFSNEIEDAYYSGLGMTFRLMPHWRIAPFIGAGGSYNHSFSGGSTETDMSGSTEAEELPSRGDSYWGGHTEVGLRLWVKNRLELFEIMGRYTWNSLEGDRDYWLVGISTGTSY